MPVTIAPVDHYAADWSDLDLTMEPANPAEGTGLTLSPSSLWLADAATLAKQIQTDDEILFAQTLPDQTPNLLDETEVQTINLTPIASGLGDMATAGGSNLLGNTAEPIDPGLLNFSLNVSGSTQSGQPTAVGPPGSGSSSSGAAAGLNSGSALITPTNTTTRGPSSLPGGGASAGPLPDAPYDGTAIAQSSEADPAAAPPTNPSETQRSSPSAVPVPLEVSPSYGLLLILALWGIQTFWSTSSRRNAPVGSSPRSKTSLRPDV